MKLIHRNGEVIFVEDDGTQRVIPLSGVEIETEARSAEDLDFSAENLPLTPPQRRAQLATLKRAVEGPREKAFASFLRYGKDALSDEFRAQAVGVDASGGFITPASFSDQLAESLQQADELFAAAALVETDFGTAFSYPLSDDTQAVATIVAENAQSLTSSPVVFGNVAFLRCPTWRSGHIVASMELAQDSAFPLGAVLANLFGKRFARGCGAQFIANLLSDADVGVTAAAQGSVTGDEILDLIAAVDPAYAVNGGFLMNLPTLIALRKLKASTAGSYLIDIDRDPNTGRTTLFDCPVFVSPSLANMGASAKPIAFGDLSRFIRRQVRNSLSVKVYTERYATSGQVAWEGFLRTDGRLAFAANSPRPVRLLGMHS